jgi:hypothetical protein
MVFLKILFIVSGLKAEVWLEITYLLEGGVACTVRAFYLNYTFTTTMTLY